MEYNPYAPPQTQITTDNVETEAEQIRRDHLSAEGALRSVGVLMTLSSFFLLIQGHFYLTIEPQLQAKMNNAGIPASPGLGIALLLLGAVQIISGPALYRLCPWARIPAALAAVGILFRFPVGTVFGLLYLYYLLNKKGTFVLSAPYREIVRATPHVKRKTSVFTIVLLVVLLIFLGFVLVGAMNR